MTTCAEWNLRYQTVTDIPNPCQVLYENVHLLPASGVALDLACGLGANAVWLAQHGLETFAWDYSSVAIGRCREYVVTHHPNLLEEGRHLLHLEVRDVITFPPPPNTFDVMVVCRFLERRLIPDIVAALKPGGMLFYQTFTRALVSAGGPKNPEYRLAENELLKMFQELQVVAYREEGEVGDKTRGFRNEAMLVARKALSGIHSQEFKA